MVKEWGTLVTGTLKSISNPDNYPMEPGKYYTTTYSVSGLRTWFPGWEDAAINDIRAGISNDRSLQGTCSPVYIRMVDSGRAVVQWRFDAGTSQVAGVSPKVPWIAVAAVIISILAVLGLWLAYKIVTSIGEVLVADTPAVRLAMIAVIIIASASLLVAGTYFYNKVVKEAIREWGERKRTEPT